MAAAAPIDRTTGLPADFFASKSLPKVILCDVDGVLVSHTGKFNDSLIRALSDSKLPVVLFTNAYSNVISNSVEYIESELAKRAGLLTLKALLIEARAKLRFSVIQQLQKHGVSVAGIINVAAPHYENPGKYLKVLMRHEATYANQLGRLITEIDSATGDDARIRGMIAAFTRAWQPKDGWQDRQKLRLAKSKMKANQPYDKPMLCNKGYMFNLACKFYGIEEALVLDDSPDNINFLLTSDRKPVCELVSYDESTHTWPDTELAANKIVIKVFADPASLVADFRAAYRRQRATEWFPWTDFTKTLPSETDKAINAIQIHMTEKPYSRTAQVMHQLLSEKREIEASASASSAEA